jgi:hypothetical protein
MGNVNGSDRVLHSHSYLPWQITPSEVGLKPIAPLTGQNMPQTALKWSRICRGRMEGYILNSTVAFWHLGKFNNISIILYIDSRLMCMQILQKGRARFSTRLF